MICIPIKGPSFGTAEDQIRRAKPLAGILEFRLDYFDDPDFHRLGQLKSACHLPVIFTLRPGSQGGNYHGSEKERLALINKLAALEPDYVDLEKQVPESWIRSFKERYPSVKVISSYHNFDQFPNDLAAIIKEMEDLLPDVIKCAVKTDTTSDALRLLQLIKRQKKTAIGTGMGKSGPVTRILAPIVGSPFTYASLDEANQTAPGQITAKDLAEIYGYQRLNKKTMVYGVIGSPVDKSIGHILHNAVMQSQNLPAVYVKLNTQKEELASFFSLAKDLNIGGLSITMPLKEEVFDFVDKVDPSAKKIGAINTIAICDGVICGTNTDGVGALRALEEKTTVEGKKMVLIGAGGAARAIAYEGVRRGAQVVVLNRHPERAERLAQEIGCVGKPLDDLKKLAAGGYDIIINCTPSPMPIEAEDIFPAAVAMEIKTSPYETDFLTKAKERGCQLVYGYKMWLYQALGQQGYWFEKSIDLEKSKELMEPLVLKVTRPLFEVAE